MKHQTHVNASTMFENGWETTDKCINGNYGNVHCRVVDMISKWCVCVCVDGGGMAEGEKG